MAKRTKKGTYKIVRMYRGDHPSRTIDRGLTEAQAQAHCRDPETSSSTCTTAACLAHTKKYGAWFDGYEKE